MIYATYQVVSQSNLTQKVIEENQPIFTSVCNFERLTDVIYNSDSPLLLGVEPDKHSRECTLTNARLAGNN